MRVSSLAAVGALLCAGACGVGPRPATYQAELVACSQTAKTLAESIACENAVRARYGRPPRDAGAP
jgi:hypothetical protein